MRNTQIVRIIGLSHSAASKVLKALVELGDAVPCGHCLHEVTATGRTAAASYTPPAEGRHQGGHRPAGVGDAL